MFNTPSKGKDRETTVQRGRCIPKWGWVWCLRFSFKYDWYLIDNLFQQGAYSFHGRPFAKNFTVKCVWWEAILGCVTSYEVFPWAHEWGQSALERLMLVCRANLKSPWIITGSPLDRDVTTLGRDIGFGLVVYSKIYLGLGWVHSIL